MGIAGPGTDIDNIKGLVDQVAGCGQLRDDESRRRRSSREPKRVGTTTGGWRQSLEAQLNVLFCIA